jgi:protein-tyrosine phosphatase
VRAQSRRLLGAYCWAELVIDLHCHVLPGIDDGPATIEGSLALARAAVDGGTHTLVATPHVSARYGNRAAGIEAAVERLGDRLREDGIELELRTGAEIAISKLAEIEPDELAQLGLGGGPYLLLEPPFTPVATGVAPIVHDMLARGHRVVLAHPERCPGFHREPRMLAELVRAGVVTSVTASSLVGRFGRDVQRYALAMLERGLAHNVTSDAHDDLRRPPSIEAELREAGADALAGWLVREVPAAVLAGADIPPRPQVSVAPKRRRRRLWRA